MKGELLYSRNPRHSRILWGLFYVMFCAFLVIGLYLMAARIKTHTLPVGGIELSVPYSKYVVGETVTFTIKNNFNNSIYIVNNCPSEPLAVYRQAGNKWVRIHDQASVGACPEEQRQVSVTAMGSTNGNFAAWPHLFDQPGNYRVIAYIENYNSLPYQDFSVIAKPTPVTPQSKSTQVTPSITTPSNTSQSTTPTVRQNESSGNEQNDN